MDLNHLVDHLDQPGIDAKPELDVIKLKPDLDEETALALQLAVKKRRAAQGDRIVGHQASFTSAGVRALFPDAPQPMVGTLLKSQMRENGSFVRLDSDEVFIESELGALLKHDLEGPDLSHAEILAAIEGFLPAIEIAPLRDAVKARLFSWPHMIAVQKAFGGYVVLGSKLTSPKGFDPRLEGCVVSMNGKARAGAVGLEAMGNPLAVIAAMARKLHAVGEKLRAGQVVITGSLPPPQVATKSDSDALLEFQTLGSVSVRIER